MLDDLKFYLFWLIIIFRRKSKIDKHNIIILQNLEF